MTAPRSHGRRRGRPDLRLESNGPQGSVSAISATRSQPGWSAPDVLASAPGDPGRLFIGPRDVKIMLSPGRVAQHVPRRLCPRRFDHHDGRRRRPDRPSLLKTRTLPQRIPLRQRHQSNDDTEIRRYQVSGNPNQADPARATLLLRVEQPAGLTNHKAAGSSSADGDLYIALGDGGGGGDPSETGQNIDDLLGKSCASTCEVTHSLAIPRAITRFLPNNPFVGSPARTRSGPSGLRNAPSATASTAGSATSTIADVGQSSFERSISREGGNYAGDVLEGFAPFEGGPLTRAPPSIRSSPMAAASAPP